MDLNSLIDQHQRSLILHDAAAIEQERAAHRQFIRDYAVRIRKVRAELVAGDAVCGLPT